MAARSTPPVLLSRGLAAALAERARLHAARAAVARRSEQGGGHLPGGAVDAVRARLDPPRRVVVERGDDLCARRGAVEQLDGIGVERLAVVGPHHVAQRLANRERT